MEVEAIVTYVVCDDTIKFWGIKKNKQVKIILPSFKINVESKVA